VIKLSRVIDNPKELILDQAKKLLHDEGYSKISIRRIAKECDIAVGTIYNYFPTKKELIVEMMTEFWKEYFYDIHIIINSDEDIYVKLKKIYDILEEFIKRFKTVWLNTEIYSTPDYIESGLKRENIYINKLIKVIEELLKKEMYNNINSKVEKQDAYEMASFIIMNFISMIQMPYMEYEVFEKILKKLNQID